VICTQRLARYALGVMAVCLAVTGCALLSTPPKVVVQKAILTEVPQDPPQRINRGDTLLVFPPRAMPLYDTTQMAYSTQPHQVAYFSEREWGATPSQMLYPLLVTTLENTRAFRAVLTEPFAGRYTYGLRTEVLELLQDFSSGSESASLVLSLRFQLTDYGAKTVIATGEVSVREPMRERNSYAGVIAANEATAKALQQMADYVLQSTGAPTD
jgi:cholesterol transport system auxiliary component